ncbi:MAG TPA: arsenate reductase ArsC [Candidatus Binatia bacterium]|nr:arsenate reductase ArsC [Candidatus Binatia bacterium]
MRRAIRERNILFLCEDNACLSQMAEAVAKHLAPPKIRVFSAGIRPSVIPAQVYKVMEELGISLSGQKPKTMKEIPVNEIDLVVSFDDADKKCGSLPPKIRIEQWRIPNPGRACGGKAAVLSTFRYGRDEVDKRVFALFLDHWRNVA